MANYTASYLGKLFCSEVAVFGEVAKFVVSQVGDFVGRRNCFCSLGGSALQTYFGCPELKQQEEQSQAVMLSYGLKSSVQETCVILCFITKGNDFKRFLLAYLKTGLTCRTGI